MSGHVYFIRAVDSGRIKIGWAKSPESRMREFQTGCSERLELLHTVEGGRDLEAAYHKVWKWCRLHNEWFHPVPCLMESIGFRTLGRWKSFPDWTPPLPCEGFCEPDTTEDRELTAW